MTEKQFPPSLQRLAKARREGKVVKSRMVSLAISWWSLTLAFIPLVAWVRNGSLVQWSSYQVWTPQVAFVEASRLGFLISLLFVGIVAGSGVISGLVQTKLLFLPSQLLRGFEQYRPGALCSRVREASIDSMVGFARCCFVLMFLLPIFFEVITYVPSPLDGIGGHELERLFSKVWSLYSRGGLAFGAIAVVAYSLARWRFFRQHRMSLQELRDENKEDEGDPHTKAHRRQEHRALLFAEVEQRVKRSKVVVVRRMTTELRK